ncbi:MAG TPA: threonine/serine exporter family protein [Vicinamibacterales bacterium]
MHAEHRAEPVDTGRAVGTAAAEPLDVALDLALLAFRNGASTVASDRAFHASAGAMGLDQAFVVWRLDNAMAGHGGRTAVRQLRPPGLNLVRTAAVADVTERLTRGAFDTHRLPSEIDRIAHLGSPYGVWSIVLATATTAGLFARLQDGHWSGVVTAAVAASAGRLLGHQMQKRDATESGMTMACALTSSLVATIFLHLLGRPVESATLISSVIYLIPGVALINGFFDVVSSRHLIVGVQRIINAVFVCALMAVAVAMVVTILG